MTKSDEQYKKELVEFLKDVRQRSRALCKIDHSLLSEEDQKKLEFEIFRNARYELNMAEELRKRCR